MPSTGIDRIDGNTTSVALKAPCTVAANNTESPVTLSGIYTIDGVTLQAGGPTDTGQGLPDRVLVNDQADKTLNGIYLVATGPWIRAYDFDGNRDAVTGTQVFVRSGNDYANTNWFLTTTDNPIEFGVSEISWSIESVTPNIADTLQIVPAASASPDVTYVGLNAVGPDAATGIGINYNSQGTTVTPGQYGGLIETHTGRHRFNINGAPALEITDTYWNPNSPTYQGAPTGYPVLSSGALAGGPDNIVVYSGESSLYTQGSGSGGVTLMHMAHGPDGEHHFTNNGVLAHVNIAAPANPNGNDTYCLANALWISGSATGSGQDAVIFTNYAESGDIATGITFYNEGTGGFKFQTDNTVQTILELFYRANGINNVAIAAGPSGYGPTIYGGGGAGVPLALAGTDTAGVLIGNGGQYNQGAGFGNIALFSGAFEPADFFTFLAGVSPAIITGSGDLELRPGSGFVNFGTFTGTPATSAGYITIHDAAGTARKLMVGT